MGWKWNLDSPSLPYHIHTDHTHSEHLLFALLDPNFSLSRWHPTSISFSTSAICRGNYSFFFSFLSGYSWLSASTLLPFHCLLDFLEFQIHPFFILNSNPPYPVESILLRPSLWDLGLRCLSLALPPTLAPEYTWCLTCTQITRKTCLGSSLYPARSKIKMCLWLPAMWPRLTKISFSPCPFWRISSSMSFLCLVTMIYGSAGRKLIT